MTIQTLDVENSDYEIFKYSQFFMTKARQFVTHYYHNFEANKIFKNVYLGSIDSVYDAGENNYTIDATWTYCNGTSGNLIQTQGTSFGSGNICARNDTVIITIGTLNTGASC